VSPQFVPTPIKCEDGTYVIPWTAPSRDLQVQRLKDEAFDVVVIGGGCVGAGVAWEAATRGLKVALVEREDFASGTSGRSTKLIHGGIRYLESAVFNLDIEMYHMVHEALRCVPRLEPYELPCILRSIHDLSGILESGASNARLRCCLRRTARLAHAEPWGSACSWRLLLLRCAANARRTRSRGPITGRRQGRRFDHAGAVVPHGRAA